MNFVPESNKDSLNEELKSVRDGTDEAGNEKSEDHRPLFERLKEQKAKRYEIVVGLDEDDADFLNTVAKNKIDKEKKILDEDNNEIQDFRKKARELDAEKKQKPLPIDQNNKNRPKWLQTQKTVLAGIKRKTQSNDTKGAKKFCLQPSVLKCVAVLPGISDLYSNDSSSDTDQFDSSESSDDEQNPSIDRDFIGRKIKQKCNNEEN